jgi:hypothetical protein
MADAIHCMIMADEATDAVCCAAHLQGGRDGLINAIFAILFAAMTDDAYYPMLPAHNKVEKKVFGAKDYDIIVVVNGSRWTVRFLGVKGYYGAPFGRAMFLADCHGMCLQEYLVYCLHMGATLIGGKKP